LFQRILSPLDGTPMAETGLTWAQDAASRCEASLELLTVIDPEKAATNGHAEEARVYLEGVKERIGEGLNVTTQVAVGDLSEEIRSRAANAELTVMTYQPGPWQFGGALDLLLQDQVNPVVVIRGQTGQPRSLTNCTKVLAPIDSSVQSMAALPEALRFCELLGATLVLCNVVSPIPGAYNKKNPPAEIAEAIQQQVVIGQQVLEQAMKGLSKQSVPVEPIICVGEPAREIIAAARDTGAGLIAMATRGSGSLSRVMSSVVLGVVQASSTPCLLVRAPAATN
jgi:nucleotide-binding universal stress UspA family protein